MRLLLLSLSMGLLALCSGTAKPGETCTHSKKCEGGYVCVFGDDALEAETEADEEGVCMSREKVQEMKKL